MKTKILAIDDDISFLNSLKRNLENLHYSVSTISNSIEAKAELCKNKYSCILLDVKMPGINGIELLTKSIECNPKIPVLMISGQSNIKIAVEAIKLGAFDFIEKPIDIEKLHITIKNAVNKFNLTIENDTLLTELNSKYKIIGKSVKIIDILNQIKKVAETNTKVLIQGETGTGKELVAWAIHQNSSRSKQPYIKINCAAIPSELLESELFGHKKGSFTGATESREGKFFAADGGTLFLDEIGDMSFSLQSKILRVLENNEIDVIGENFPRKIDVRIIAATNKNLVNKITEGSFREDLFYRLNVMNITIPPLRERKDDILPLAFHFLAVFNEVYNKQILDIDNEAKNIVLNYDWKGNVRELRNVIEKAVIFSNNLILEVNDFKKVLSYLEEKAISYDDNFLPLKDAKLSFEKEHILKILNKNEWKINQSAEELGIDRTNLFKKMQKLGIEKDS